MRDYGIQRQELSKPLRSLIVLEAAWMLDDWYSGSRCTLSIALHYAKQWTKLRMALSGFDHALNVPSTVKLSELVLSAWTSPCVVRTGSSMAPLSKDHGSPWRHYLAGILLKKHASLPREHLEKPQNPQQLQICRWMSATLLCPATALQRLLTLRSPSTATAAHPAHV